MAVYSPYGLLKVHLAQHVGPHHLQLMRAALVVPAGVPINTVLDLLSWMEGQRHPKDQRCTLLAADNVGFLKSLLEGVGLAQLADAVEKYERDTNQHEEMVLCMAESYQDEVTIMDVEAAAGDVSKFWPRTVTQLNVYFIDGDAALRSRVIATASEWSKYAALTFRAVDEISTSHIRITFEGVGCWSAIGTDASLKKFSARPTMCLAPLRHNPPDVALFARKVLHEFGHALGLIHEHQNPDQLIPWNEQAVFKSYEKMGWSKDKIRHNVLDARQVSQYTKFDPASIMLYPIPRAHVLDPKFACETTNSTLSAEDKAFIHAVYSAPAGPTAGAINIQEEATLIVQSSAPLQSIARTSSWPVRSVLHQLVKEITQHVKAFIRALNEIATLPLADVRTATTCLSAWAGGDMLVNMQRAKGSCHRIETLARQLPSAQVSTLAALLTEMSGNDNAILYKMSQINRRAADFANLNLPSMTLEKWTNEISVAARSFANSLLPERKALHEALGALRAAEEDLAAEPAVQDPGVPIIAGGDYDLYPAWAPPLAVPQPRGDRLPPPTQGVLATPAAHTTYSAILAQVRPDLVEIIVTGKLVGQLLDKMPSTNKIRASTIRSLDDRERATGELLDLVLGQRLWAEFIPALQALVPPIGAKFVS